MEGYVLSDEPDVVRIPSSLVLKLVLWGISLLLAAGGVYIIAAAIKARSNYNFLLREGNPANGEIVGIRRDGTSKSVFYVAKIKYIDSNGNEHFFEDYSDRNNRRVGDKCHVQYAQKKNGKFVTEIVN